MRIQHTTFFTVVDESDENREWWPVIEDLVILNEGSIIRSPGGSEYVVLRVERRASLYTFGQPSNDITYYVESTK